MSNFKKTLWAVILIGSLWANEDKIRGAYAKVTTHQDGSRSFYEESEDKTLVTQKNFSPAGKLNFVSTFKFDTGLNPRVGKIEDPNGRMLVKIRYAYERETGRLSKEAFFDMTKNRLNPKTGQPQPIQIVIHRYGSDGRTMQPQVVELIPKEELAKLLNVPLQNATLIRE